MSKPINNMDKPERTVHTVSEFTARLKQTLEENFDGVWVQGEISGLSQPGSGHCYFNLNDENAQLRAVVWRSTLQRMKFELEEGQQVICCGDIDIYPPRGTYQLIVRKVEPLGEGKLQIAFRQLHQKLSAEGLFEAQHKRPLPRFPQRIAVVTSPTGAAIRDFCQIVKRRWPQLHILILGCRVQGTEAPREIIEAIRQAARIHPPLDAVVVTRGGGSIEDLWSFNDEQVVRAIRACPIPTLSAIGHEIDITLTDLAADVRAVTPSEAAEVIAPDQQEWMAALEESSSRMRILIRQLLIGARRRLDAITSQRSFRRPDDLLKDRYQRIDILDQKLRSTMERTTERHRHRWQQAASQLQAVNPLAVLRRGYSITTDMQGHPLGDANQVNVGDDIKTVLEWGTLVSQIRGLDQSQRLQ